jgi:hypothetical protein
MTRKHDLIKTGDPDVSDAIKDRNGEVVLTYCRVCKEGEGSLAATCPGPRALLKSYRCKHAIEAMRWTDTDANREAFAAWFETHDARFETHGPEVVLPEEGVVAENEWIVFSDGEFLVMDDEMFTDTYEEIGTLR